VYLVIEQPNEALNCIQEASLINPMSHQLLFMVTHRQTPAVLIDTNFYLYFQRGQVHLHQSQLMEAKQCFLNAVSANPYHTEALRSLGEVHYLMGEPRLAEKTLKDAVKIDPNSPEIWFTLGQVAESLGDYNASADCLATALQLEPSCPVLPFTSIGLTFE
jgi:tetratricopeptide repeat protein 7